MVNIVQAQSEEHLRHARQLFTDYFDYLRRDVDTTVDDLNEVYALAGYEEELAHLPGKYAPPDGRLWLAYDDEDIAGCVAFCKWRDGICEVKRLWIDPHFRGRKIGRLLMETLIAEARQSGYQTMVLSTVAVMKEAVSLYERLGFEPTECYFDNPDDAMDYEIFMKLALV